MKLSRRRFLKGAVGAVTVAAGGSVLLTGFGPQEQPDAATEATPPGNNSWEPAYLRLERSGELAERVEQAYARLEHCDLCPRKCGVNRLKGERGLCRAPEKVVVYSAQPHFGEERPLVGRNGSGTIFFSNCNLRCVFCQNWPIAHEGRGREIDDEELAETMLRIERRGCPNINLVTPTHIMPHILNATRIAARKGMRTPLCYNTGGYERAEVVRMLDGIVDIYLPDLKFMDAARGEKYLGGAPDYPENAKAAILEMHRQVGVLETDSAGVARRGVMIRHLVMPNHVSDPLEFVDWVAANLPKSTYVNIMSQYRVEHEAFNYPDISRSITSEEFVSAIEHAKEVGLTNLDDRSLSNYESHRRRM